MIDRTIELYEDRDLIRWTERDQLTGLLNSAFFIAMHCSTTRYIRAFQRMQ